MTGSDAVQRRANRIFDLLTRLIDEEQVVRQIDQPIDQVLEDFECPDIPVHSQARFHQVITDFMQHLHKKALPGSRDISSSQAHDEAMALLESQYQGSRSNGYPGAVLDAADADQPGLPLVLARLAEAVKAIQRLKYTRWAATRYLAPADWPTKCALAAILLERNRACLPLELEHYPPEQFADEIPELLKMDLALESQTQLGSISWFYQLAMMPEPF